MNQINIEIKKKTFPLKFQNKQSRNLILINMSS